MVPLSGQRLVTLAGLLVLLLAPSAPSQAQEKQPAEVRRPRGRGLHRVDSTHRLGGRINPLGLAWRSFISYQLRLFESDSLALANNFIGIGVNPTFSPAGTRLGAFVDIQPLSLLRLRASYEWIGYIGTFDLFQSFPSATSEFSDDTLDDLAGLPENDPRRNYSAAGTQLTLSALLQAKIGPIAARNEVSFGRVDMDLRQGDRTYWDISYDLLIGDEGWFFVNNLDVLWISDFGLAAGLRWSSGHAFYEDRHYAEGEDTSENPNTPIHRLGPLITYTFFDNGGLGAYNKPTVFLIVNWWLEHRYRTGAEQSVALPYVALGFAFTGDLLQL